MKSTSISLFVFLSLFVFACKDAPKKWKDETPQAKTESPAAEEEVAAPAVEEEAAPSRPDVRFEVTSIEKSSTGYTDENPVAYVYYMNSVAIRVNGKKYVLNNYQCTLHGAGECGEVGRDNFEPNSLVLPQKLASKDILKEAFVGNEIERGWNSYSRYLAVFEDDGVSVYEYGINSFENEVPQSEVKRIRRIEL